MQHLLTVRFWALKLHRNRTLETALTSSMIYGMSSESCILVLKQLQWVNFKSGNTYNGGLQVVLAWLFASCILNLYHVWSLGLLSSVVSTNCDAVWIGLKSAAVKQMNFQNTWEPVSIRIIISFSVRCIWDVNGVFQMGQWYVNRAKLFLSTTIVVPSILPLLFCCKFGCKVSVCDSTGWGLSLLGAVLTFLCTLTVACYLVPFPHSASLGRGSGWLGCCKGLGG